jgi:hypothetical protein
MFNFTPLLGAQSPSSASQSLLEFDGGIKVLIDAGWDESFDTEKLKEIEKYVACYLSSFAKLQILPTSLEKSPAAKRNKTAQCYSNVNHKQILTIVLTDMSLLYLSFSSPMRRLRILEPLPIAANTFLYSRAYPSTRLHL